jgi:hypothetical protein
MNLATFWDTTPCTPLKINRRFGETYGYQLTMSKNKPSNKPGRIHVKLILYTHRYLTVADD